MPAPTATISLDKVSVNASETAVVTIKFLERVEGFDIGALSSFYGSFTLLTGVDGDTTYTAEFTPNPGVTSTAASVSLNLAAVTTMTDMTPGSGMEVSSNFTVDTAAPTVTSIVVPNFLMAVGETTTVSFTFSEAVSGFTTADLTVANGVVSGLSTGDGGVTWTATFTPGPGVTDTTNLITLDNTGIADLAGNPGSGTSDSNNYAIDTVRPTATNIVMNDTALKIGDTSEVTFTFSEAVSGFTTADLTVANGSVTGLSTSDGGVTWKGTLTPAPGVTDATNLITLDNTGITDLAGNAGSDTFDSGNYAIDTVRPTATSIVMNDTALKAGETAAVTITFSEAVTSFTTADLTVANGSVTGLSTGDGGVTWTATFTPSADIADTTNLITLDNTGIIDLAGNAGSGTFDSGNYAIDTVRPTATSIVMSDTALKAGETAEVTITFSEAVTSFATADLTVANGSVTGLSTSDGGVTWTATFTPSANIADTTNLITLANTGITDLAGNPGSGTFDSGNYAIDTARPTATVTLAKSALAAGESTVVTIKFSEEVTDFDNTNLSIDSGTLSTVITSDGGVTWTTTFTPNITVTDSTNVIGLNYAGINDLAGNAGVGTTTSANFTITITEPPIPPEPTTPTPTPGDDVITLPAAGGTISAGEGADSVAGAAGDDFIHGNVGDDTVSGGGGDDIVRGGQGSDFVHGNTGEDLIFGDLGDDTAAGGQGADFVQGNAGNDYVAGDLGNDTVLGGQGADIVLGGAGDDYVSGDLGDDTLTGGAGADLFNFSNGSGHDVVTDFSRAEGDHIRISPSDAADFSALSITSQGADTLITLGAQTVVLVGVSAGSLTAADFVFA